LGNLKKRDQVGRRRRRVQDILKKPDEAVWIGFIWLRIRTSGRLLWHQYEPSGSMPCGKFLDWPRNYWLHKDNSSLWSYLGRFGERLDSALKLWHIQLHFIPIQFDARRNYTRIHNGFHKVAENKRLKTKGETVKKICNLWFSIIILFFHYNF
jgi:hypothetical protein